ncbi:MAG: S24 family peptidase [Burkholderiales bacterium]|nr:S24 family peptidase [Burkholderiales bacterium]
MSEAPRWVDADGGCSGAESFALRVLGEDMAPEFRHGEIIVVEPDGALKDGSFVVAQHEGRWTLRQLRRADAGWVLHALNPAPHEPRDAALADLGAVRGVVIQKSVPGRRRLTKFYV